MKIDNNLFYKKIQQKLAGLRSSLALNKAMQHLIWILFSLGIVLMGLVTLEGFLYLDPAWKNILLKTIYGLTILSVIGLILEYVLIRSNRLSAYNDQNLARKAGYHYAKIGDSLVNTIQLWSGQKTGFSSDLIKADLESTYNKIKNRDFTAITSQDKIWSGLKFFSLELIAFILLFLMAGDYYSGASHRFFHPSKKYEVPQPFTIINQTEQSNILGGDTVHFQFATEGKFPDQIKLDLNYKDYQKTEILPVDSTGSSRLVLKNVRRNLNYQAYAENKSIFIPWDKISSNRDSITVTDRPEIVQINCRIQYPDYTDKPEENKEMQNTELFAIPGSKLYFHLKSNKVLEKGSIVLNDSTNRDLKIDGKTGFGRLIAHTNQSFHFGIMDPNGVTNIKPIEYQITITPDKYPRLTVITPQSDIKLNESMQIPIGVQISDDFGITDLRIKYKIQRKYGGNQKDYQFTEIPFDNGQTALRKIYHDWDLNSFNLSPEDKVIFQIAVLDNDQVNGPKVTSSRQFTALFPSLNDLYTSVQNEQQGIYKKGQEIVKQLQNTKEVLDKAHRKLLKNRKLSWEQNKQLEEEVKKTQKLEKQIKDISKKIDKVIKKAQENNLFDEKTLEKYMQLQQTFQELMSPELKKAMQDLQKAVDKMDPQKTKQALNKFRTNRDDFEKELDRQLELFKKIKAEQAMDELVKRMQDLTKRQTEMSEKLDTNANRSRQENDKLAQQESEIQRDTEIVKDILKRTAQDLKDMPLMPDKEMENILDQMEKQNLTDQMESIQKQIKQNQNQKAQKNSELTQQQLQQFQKMMEKMREDFRQKSMQEIAKKFHKIIKNSMNLSKEQEKLNQRIKNTPAHSSRLMDEAIDQQRLRDNLNKLLAQMGELSKQTMGLSAKVSQIMGQSYNNMTSSIKNMEDRNPRQAAGKGEKAVHSLNMGSKVMMSSLKSLQSSGSSSGFENYMKQLQKMAKQQKNLNQQTQQMQQGGMPQMSMPGNRQSMLQQLAARQQQIQNSLQNLQEQMQGQSEGGGKQLEGAGKDMEKVIEDLQNNKVLKKTLDRQNRILTRLLDAQKSLRTQGYKKERKSTAGQDMEYTGPAQLPSDLGEKENYLRQRLEEALNNNYSREYEELIRLYFEELSRNDIQKENQE